MDNVRGSSMHLSPLTFRGLTANSPDSYNVKRSSGTARGIPALDYDGGISAIAVNAAAQRSRQIGCPLPPTRIQSPLVRRPLILQFTIGHISCASLPILLEDTASFFLLLSLAADVVIGPLRKHLSILPVLPPTLMIGISTRPRHAHLDKFPSHVGAYKVATLAIGFEDAP
jgi:hypothetical protein